MKQKTIFGALIGFGLAFAIILGGFSGFVWALVFSAVGTAIGAHYDGYIDLKSIFDNATSGRGGRG